MKLRVLPLTEDLWPAFEDLFEDGATCKRCWCMYWRIGGEYRERPAGENKKAFHQIVRSDRPPGLLAFDEDKAVGWCQLSPRDSLPKLEKASSLKRVDDLPVWCISCFYIRKGYRKQGVTSILIREALKVARKEGAPALEAYPLDAELTPSASFTGYVSTYLNLGFKIVARHTPSRPIMRYSF